MLIYWIWDIVGKKKPNSIKETAYDKSKMLYKENMEKKS
jgi:hypothetical protein